MAWVMAAARRCQLQQRVTRSKAHVRALVHFFGKGCSTSGLPPSRILIFRERLMNRLCGLSCWLA